MIISSFLPLNEGQSFPQSFIFQTSSITHWPECIFYPTVVCLWLDTYIHMRISFCRFDPISYNKVYKERKQGLSTSDSLWPFPHIMMNYAVEMIKNIVLSVETIHQHFRAIGVWNKSNGECMHTKKIYFIQRVPVEIKITK